MVKLLESLPLKQGLKHHEPETGCHTADLLESLPLKQGLKQKKMGAFREGELPFRVTSIKTRIETPLRSRGHTIQENF